MGPNGGRTSDSVENYGWGKGAAVENWLFAEGYKFDFFQAVRLLEMIQAAGQEACDADEGNRKRSPRVSPGEGADPGKEIVRFRSAVNLDFPSSDIAAVNSGNGVDEPTAMVAHFKKRDVPAEMTVNFLGLAGSLGALDIPTTELVLQRTSRDDRALKDFLDIFNHRLVSLLYQIRKRHRVGLGAAAPGEDQISGYLYSMIGLGSPHLRGRMLVRDRALLNYAGILAQQRRSMVGLERILADYFQVNVKGHQFGGAWCELEESQWTTIGASGRNQRLGRDTVVVGTRVWDQHARFEIHLGPLTLEEFLSFLPTKWRFGALCDLIRFYVRDQFDFTVRLILKAAEVPEAKLEDSQPELSLLSWTSWLGGGRDGQVKPKSASGRNSSAGPPDPYITISPEALRSGSKSIKSWILSRLPRGKQAELLGMMKTKPYAKNTIVMLQKSPGNKMYVIRRGNVQISRQEEKGKEAVVGILREGDCFGEQALLMGKSYSETALTLTECELAIIGREDLSDMAAKYPNLRRTIEAYVTESGHGRAPAAIRKGSDV